MYTTSTTLVGEAPADPLGLSQALLGQRRVDDVAHRTAAHVGDVLLPVPDEDELRDGLHVGEEGIVED